MSQEFTLKIAGAAGEGIKSSGLMFAKAMLRGGYYAADTDEYPSLIRGGHNTYLVTISPKKISAPKKAVDLLIALNEESVELHKEELSENGGIIYDVSLDISSINGLKEDRLKPIPFEQLLSKTGGMKIMKNTIALGAVMGMLDCELKELFGVIEEEFADKKESIVRENKEAAEIGFKFAKENYGDVELKPGDASRDSKKKMIYLTGNDAVTAGAVKAGCKFYVAYPMTPASSILHNFAALEREYDVITKHAEDEIAVMHMAIGASNAGVRSMLATSGGGFALMVEGLALAGMTETPLVAVEVQRAGPATGLPTWHEQGDLKFLLSAGHGEFPRVVVAPGDVDECFYETFRAFNIAEKYQVPVLILSDRYLGEGHFSTEYFDQKGMRIERGAMITDKALARLKDFKRYEFTEDGISPRSIPGQRKGIFLANSDEHDEYGLSCESRGNRELMVDKRWRKVKELKSDIPKPKLYGDKKADLTIIGWGSTKGVIRKAMKQLREEGLKINHLHMLYLSPFPTKRVEKVLEKSKRVVVIENNKTGQLAQVIRENTGYELKGRINKYDGRPFWSSEVVERVKELV